MAPQIIYQTVGTTTPRVILKVLFEIPLLITFGMLRHCNRKIAVLLLRVHGIICRLSRREALAPIPIDALHPRHVQWVIDERCKAKGTQRLYKASANVRVGAGQEG